MTMMNDEQERLEVACVLVSTTEGRASLSALTGTERIAASGYGTLGRNT
jgi:hypothetical protein